MERSSKTSASFIRFFHLKKKWVVVIFTWRWRLRPAKSEKKGISVYFHIISWFGDVSLAMNSYRTFIHHLPILELSIDPLIQLNKNNSCQKVSRNKFLDQWLRWFAFQWRNHFPKKLWQSWHFLTITRR